MTVAICYFGLTRSTKVCYESHIENIYNILKNNNEDYDVFLHTWELENGIQKIWERTISNKIDYDEYKLLNPKYFKRDNQEEYEKTIDFNKYYYIDVAKEKGHKKDGEWVPGLIRNHLCALESQKRVFEMVQQTKKSYDYIIVVRPDSFIVDKLPLDNVKNFLSKNPKGINIPAFDKFEGYNDRFAIMKYSHAEKYCKRIEEIAEFRKTEGRIVSEKYVKYICDKYYEKVNLIPFGFKLLRPSDKPPKPKVSTDK